MSDPTDYDLPDKQSHQAEFKARIQRFYGSWNRRLQQSDFGDISLFMNWGYAPDGHDQAVLEPAPEAINKTSVRLVLELVGTVPVHGCAILDVGCGRGGTVDTLLRYFEPAHVTGIDLTAENISFCRRAVTRPRAEFREGDAENLPFADASFDIVTNLESSHCYPDIDRFYHEVARVLKPGGCFLYTDVFDMREYPSLFPKIQRAGLDIESDRNITPNVLLARHLEGEEQADNLNALPDVESNASDDRVLDLVVARPGSEMYEALVANRHNYRILRARKQLTAGRPSRSSIANRAMRQRKTLGC